MKTLFCDGCKSKMPHPFTEYRGGFYCSLECFRKVEDKTKSIKPEKVYKNTIDEYPPNWRDA